MVLACERKALIVGGNYRKSIVGMFILLHFMNFVRF